MERNREQLVDALLAVAISALAVSSVLSEDPTVAYEFRQPGPAVAGLALAASLPLAVRRRWPLAVCVVVVAATGTIGALRWNAGLTPFCILLALFAVGAWSDRRRAGAGLALAYAGIGVLALVRAPYFDHPLALVFVVAMTTSWALGRAMSRGRNAREGAVARALEAERARAMAAERAVLAERLHIARELHDVVSHTLSVIAVQSGVARHRLEHGPSHDRQGAVVPALSAIETASRGALDDLRRMVGLLRAAPRESGAPVTGASTATPPEAPSRVREGVVDAAAAVALAALGIGTAYVTDPSVVTDYADPNAGLVALILLACLPLAARRRWPFTVFVVAGAATTVAGAMGWNAEFPGFASFVALYTVAAWRPLSVVIAGLGLFYAVEAAQWLTNVATRDPVDLLGVLVPVALGLILRRWRHERDAAHARALEAERTRAVAAERAVFAERLRIAGELHDVVTHTLSAVAVQSAVARHQLGDRPGPAGPALAAVEEASRVALDDLRRMLGVLHEEAEGVDLRPSPGLAELDLLASAHRAAHGPVELTVDPAVRSAPDSVQMTAFRLVQEALTNVRKHAPGAPARVDVTCADGQVTVRVDDDGQGAPTTGTGTGYGLAGMRERVALFGGSVDAGPRPEGGFRVEATLRTVAA